MSFNLSNISLSQDLPFHCASGREVLYQKLREVPSVVVKAFEDFQKALFEAQNKLWKLQKLEESTNADIFLYDLKKHKFTLLSPDFVEVFTSGLKITEEQNKTYLRDFLKHSLIPKLAKQVIGEEFSEEMQRLEEFIDYKLNKEETLRVEQKDGTHSSESWAHLVEKVQKGTMKSANEKLERKQFKKTLEGQLAIKSEELEHLKARGVNLSKIFDGINLDVIELKLWDDRKTPVTSFGAKETKEKLKEILALLRRECALFEEFKSIANRRNFENLLNEWNNLEENQEDLWCWRSPKSVFLAFKDVLCELLKEAERHCAEVEELESAIDSLAKQIEEKELQNFLELDGEAEDEDSISCLDDSLSAILPRDEHVNDVEGEKNDSSVISSFDRLEWVLLNESVSSIDLEEEKNEESPDDEMQNEGESSHEEILERAQDKANVCTLIQPSIFDLKGEESFEAIAPNVPLAEVPLLEPLPPLKDQVDKDAAMPASGIAALANPVGAEQRGKNEGVSTFETRGVELNTEPLPSLKSRLIRLFAQFKSYAQKTLLGLWNRVSALWRLGVR